MQLRCNSQSSDLRLQRFTRCKTQFGRDNKVKCECCGAVHGHQGVVSEWFEWLGVGLVVCIINGEAKKSKLFLF